MPYAQGFLLYIRRMILIGPLMIMGPVKASSENSFSHPPIVAPGLIVILPRAFFSGSGTQPNGRRFSWLVPLIWRTTTSFFPPGVAFSAYIAKFSIHTSAGDFFSEIQNLYLTLPPFFMRRVVSLIFSALYSSISAETGNSCSV